MDPVVYEILKLVGAALSAMVAVNLLWVRPEKERRNEVQRRLVELEKDMALAQRDLKAGDKKFDEVIEDLKDVKATLHRLEKAFAAVSPALAREMEG